MSEKQPLIEKGSEHLLESSTEKGSETFKTPERQLTQAETEHGQAEALKQHRTAVEQHTKPSESMHVPEKEQTSRAHPLIASVQLKTAAWARVMTRTRKKLALPDRAFSKVIHSSAIDKPSELIGKTIARPSGMLWGSMIAFIGTSLLLWVTRHYGYEYNYLLVVLLFVFGVILGNVLEFTWYLFRKKRQS